jgi:hypothetical protein
MRDDQDLDDLWETMEDDDENIGSSSRSKFDLPPLTIKEWRSRELPPPDKLLGEWLTTTSRILLTADTGLGKTNLCMAIAGAMAAGQDFLHWRARRTAKVLYIDGEMSRPLLKERIEDVARRLGCEPENLLFLSNEDFEDFPPLNTPEGIAMLNDLLDCIGETIDFIFFDNIMALIQGDQKDEIGWTAVLPLVNSLTKRRIGQLWVNHTGHNATRGYGTKTREWRVDTTIHLMAVERADSDICFQFEFRKARTRTPKTRADYQDVTIALVEDKWIGTVGVSQGKPSDKEACVLEAFDDLVKDRKATQRPNGHWAVKADDWERECDRRGFANGSAFRTHKSRLAHKKIIECDGEWSWRK